MSEVEIGAGKRGRRAYAFDDIAVVPSRRTRDPRDVSVQWSIDAFTFASPILSAPMDSVSSPATVIQMGKLGILGVLDLEGLWTRYEDPSPYYDEIKSLTDGNVTKRMQEIYSEPIKAELITARLAEIRAAGVPVAGSLSPQRTQEFSKTVVDAGVDLFVIRGTTVSAEHVSQNEEPLNLKKFIYELDVPVIVGGASTYTSALHLMRTGAAGVLVGFGGGAASTTRAALGIHAPMATAVADVAGARRDYLDESGGRYVHVIADGGLDTAGDVVKAIAMGADAVMLGTALARATEAPGRWLPLGCRGAPPGAAPRPPGRGGHDRPARERPERPDADLRRPREPRRCPAPLDGDDRILRRQGVPASRSGRGAVPPADGGTRARAAGDATAPTVTRRRRWRSPARRSRPARPDVPATSRPAWGSTPRRSSARTNARPRSRR